MANGIAHIIANDTQPPKVAHDSGAMKTRASTITRAVVATPNQGCLLTDMTGPLAWAAARRRRPRR